MDPESKKMLEEALALARENSAILHSINRSMRVQRIMGYLYWVFIIGSAVGVYYLIQPYIDQLVSVYSGVGEAINSFKQFGQ